MAQATVTKTVRISESIADALSAAAKATGRSENSLVTVALVAYLSKLAKAGTIKIEVL